MRIERNDIEEHLLGLVKKLRGDAEENYAIHFHLSRLSPEYRSEFQMKIAVNILNDVFRQSRGYIFQARDGDIFVIYHGKKKALIEQAVYQIRYLFADDELAYTADQHENTDFCHIYDLSLQWRAFYRVCTDRSDMSSAAGSAAASAVANRSKSQLQSLTPEGLTTVLNKLEIIDFDFLIRKQPICAIPKSDQVRPVYDEIYVSLAHLRKLLGMNVALASDPWLFQHLASFLDQRVLQLLGDHPRAHLQEPVSLNLTIETVIGTPFEEFMKQLRSISSSRTILIEIHVSDLFTNIHQLSRLQDVAKHHNARLCLDGLTDQSLKLLNRERIGFDLLKMQWNADMPADLKGEHNEELIAAIKRNGASRIILCRCDSHHAIEYGQQLGIGLFQGRHPDRLINPDSSVIN